MEKWQLQHYWGVCRQCEDGLLWGSISPFPASDQQGAEGGKVSRWTGASPSRSSFQAFCYLSSQNFRALLWKRKLRREPLMRTPRTRTRRSRCCGQRQAAPITVGFEQLIFPRILLHPCLGQHHNSDLLELHIERVVILANEHAHVRLQYVGLLLRNEIDIAHDNLGQQAEKFQNNPFTTNKGHSLTTNKPKPGNILNFWLGRKHCHQWRRHPLAECPHLKVVMT